MQNRPAGKPEVVFFHRKPRHVGNYSLEFIFKDVRQRLQNRINARVVTSKYESAGFFKRLYNCWEAYREQGAVNHVTGDVNYLGLFLKRRNTIQTVLDCVYLTSATGIKYKVLRYFWLVLPERRSRFITAISESTKNEILKHHACHPDKIVVIPVAISPNFKPSPTPFNRHMPTILQIGTAPNKNLPKLIEALKGIPCTLNIIGKHNSEYEDMLKRYGINYNYEWNLSDEEIIARYGQADIISLVSTYEGFGMPILEGQAVGKPVITSNLYSMPEVAGTAAVLVNPHDENEIRAGLQKIIHDDEFRTDLIRRGFENVKRFDPEVIAMQYFQLYKKIDDKA